MFNSMVLLLLEILYFFITRIVYHIILKWELLIPINNADHLVEPAVIAHIEIHDEPR